MPSRLGEVIDVLVFAIVDNLVELEDLVRHVAVAYVYPILCEPLVLRGALVREPLVLPALVVAETDVAAVDGAEADRVAARNALSSARFQIHAHQPSVPSLLGGVGEDVSVHAALYQQTVRRADGCIRE